MDLSTGLIHDTAAGFALRRDHRMLLFLSCFITVSVKSSHIQLSSEVALGGGTMAKLLAPGQLQLMRSALRSPFLVPILQMENQSSRGGNAPLQWSGLALRL